MGKRRYRVLRGLAYPTNPKAIRRIRAGERVPWAERKAREAGVGAIVDDIPAVSVPWLLQRGIIEEVSDDAER